MTVFGRTLGAEEIASLIAMLAVLVLWFGVLRGQRDWSRWITRSDAGRKAQRAAGVEVKDPPAQPDPAARDPKRPWG